MIKRRLGFIGIIVAAAVTVTGCGALSKAEFSRCTISDNTLKSELFKFQAEVGSDWVFGTDDEIASLNGMSGSTASDFEKAIKENEIFYDAMCRKSTGSNFIIAVPNPDKVKSNIFTSEKAYAEATLDGVKEIDSNASISTLTFAGKDHPAIKVDNESMGTSFKQCMVFVKSSQFVCMITFTCFSDEEIDEVMGYFSSL